MHQTFYIDVDEEITSVIDRLKKSMAIENYFVVPQRALFMQSVVNLKLLKREADKAGKQVMIVTQDELGRGMAEKAGLFAQASAEGLEPNNGIEINKEENEEILQIIDDKEEIISAKRKRLSDIGSNDFYAGIKVDEITMHKTRSMHANMDANISRSQKNGRVTIKQSRNVPPHDSPLKQKAAHASLSQKKNAEKSIKDSRKANFAILDPVKERTIEKMFETKAKDVDIHIPVGRKTKKIFASFIVLCLGTLFSVAVYLFLPKADLKVTLDSQQKKMNVQILGGVDKVQSSSEMTIPIRVIEKEDSVSFSYDSTGKDQSLGKKAQGNVTIFNEFSGESQQLVANTRLESQSGKIFHIVRSVTIPGYLKNADEIRPGSVEIDIIADEPGDEYNMDNAVFTIPGFKGGAKFEKFSAKNNTPITGGVSQNGGPAIISNQDLQNAKTESEKNLRDKMLRGIAEKLDKDEMLLDQAFQFAVKDSSTTSKAGDIKSSFEYNTSGKLTAFVFSKKDVENTIDGIFRKDFDANKFNPTKIENIDYTGTTADFDGKVISIKMSARLFAIPIFDGEKVKNEMLGKNEGQLEDFVKKMPGIKNVDIEFFPSFVSRVPQYPNRVTLEVKE